MDKRKIMFKLVDFFNEQGRILSFQEYKDLGTEAPFKVIHIKRYWGTWNRAMKAISKLVDFDNDASEPYNWRTPTENYDWGSVDKEVNLVEK